MAVKIVTDSVSDISPQIADEYGITVVPLNVNFGPETFRDGVDISTEEFYRRLQNGDVLPSSGSPSPQIFSDAYEKLASSDNEILVITIGQKLSVTGEAARQGIELMSSKICRVEVVVSEQAMMAEGLLAIAAAKAAQNGASLDDLVQLTKRNMDRVGLRIAFDTLEYLKRGGRIGKAQALVGTVLGINPILGIKDGEVFPFARERSRQKAMDYLYKFAAGYRNIEEIAIEDATTPEETDALVKRLEVLTGGRGIYRTKVSPVIGTNVGPRAIGLAVLGDM